MTLKEINTEHLRKHLNQHGQITVINKAGYKDTLFGYVREVTKDTFIIEDNETGQRFTFPLPATFKKIPLKKEVELKNV
jgi:hypothetical protein